MSPHTGRPVGVFSLLAATLVAGLLLVAAGPRADAAAGGWTLTASPTSVRVGVSTSVVLTATDGGAGNTVGCIEIQLSSAWTVSRVALVSVTTGLHWTVDPVSAGLVTVHGANEADSLAGAGQFVRFSMTVTGTPVGTYTWRARAFDHANCSAGVDSATLTIKVVAAAPTPTRPPAASPKPTMRATPSATIPSRSATPLPSPTETLAAPSSAPTSTGPSPTGSPESRLSPGPSVDPYNVPGAGGGDTGGLPGDLTAGFAYGNALILVVPAVVLTIPGLLLALIAAALAFGGAAWLAPFRRRGRALREGGRASQDGGPEGAQ